MSTSGLTDAESACLQRTRSAVLNVLIVAGVGIALSGFLLRKRDDWPPIHVETIVKRALMFGLAAVGLASYIVNRTLCGRGSLRDPDRRAGRFFRGRVLAAAIAFLAIPLGLVYGWVDEPSLNVVGPFWLVGLALGLLAFPRATDLSDFDVPMANIAGTDSNL